MSYKAAADLARSKAIEAMHQGRPVAAREWLEAAAVADGAAHALAPKIEPELRDTLERLITAVERLAALQTRT
jgi:hypothetical protein